MQLHWKKLFILATIMKIVFFLVVFSQVKWIENVFGSLASISADEAVFRNWMSEHSKAYNSQTIFHRKFKIFAENQKIVQKLNAEKKKFGSDVEFALNKFADMTTEEFRKQILMPKRKPDRISQSRIQFGYKLDGALPDHFDWKPKNILGSVRDQGDAGTCWAFSAVQVVETQWAMKTGNSVELSVEQVVDCDGSYNEKEADCGVFGGWPYLAYDYIKFAGGIQTEKDYPYCCGLGGEKGTCYVCPAPGYNKTLCGPPVEYCKQEDSCEKKINKSLFVPGLKVKSWSQISRNETEMAKALMELGPLSVLINSETLQFYKGGVWDPIICDPTSLDHAVLLTGFGSAETVLRTKKYWIVKNSWGSKWGENGYFRIARNKKKCGIEKQVTVVDLAND